VTKQCVYDFFFLNVRKFMMMIMVMIVEVTLTNCSNHLRFIYLFKIFYAYISDNKQS